MKLLKRRSYLMRVTPAAYSVCFTGWERLNARRVARGLSRMTLTDFVSAAIEQAGLTELKSKR